MFSVYAIYNSIRNKIYIGQTIDIEQRLKRHNGILKSKEKSFTNKNSGRWNLIYEERVSTREKAFKREKELKSYRGREFIRKIIHYITPP